VARRWRAILLVTLVGLLWATGQQPANAHAALLVSDPIDGAVFNHTAPTSVRLSFSEDPEPSLSTIEVSDTTGARYDTENPHLDAGDPRSLAVTLKPLGRGVYTVTWRAFSRVDGHPTSGAFAFGVDEVPTLRASTSAVASPLISRLEVVGRWVLVVGLVGLVGVGAAVGVGVVGRASGGALGAGAWVASAAGLVMLAEAQRRNASATYATLFSTSVGHALAWRGVGIVGCGAALLVAQIAPQKARRVAMTVVAIGSAAAIAVHVDNGHAAAVQSLRWASVGAQWLHVAAVGVWLGGLLTLVLAIRGAPSTAKAAMIQRFSTLAPFALAIVVVTGVVGAFREVESWDDLTGTSYGRTILAKSALLIVIAGLAGLNRWRNVRLAPTELRPLRRTSTAEIALAAAALLAAAILAGLAPPTAQAATARGLEVEGHDFATSVKVRLSTVSSSPGPNRFRTRVTDYDTGQSVAADRVTLRFSAVDDPEVAPTTLALSPEGDGSYVAFGNNLAFDGRWDVTTLIELRATSVSVPLSLETRSPPLFVSITRIPGQAPEYAVQMADENNVIFSPNPERPGPSELAIVYVDLISDERSIAKMVLTVAEPSAPAREVVVRRVSRGRFVADLQLRAGRTRITAIARTPDGTRLWAAFELNVSGG
jgi:putative copper export protein/methionine-rich copper-binding protein CopC